MSKDVMNKTLILILLSIVIVLLGVHFVSADDTQRLGKQNEPYDIKESCFNNGDYCSSSARCNITVYNPNSSLVVNNEVMTNQVSYHNYTLNVSQTVNVGLYPYVVKCSDSGLSNAGTFGVFITPSGTNPNTSQGIMYLVLSGVSLLVGMLLFFLAWNIDGRNWLNEYGVQIVNIKKYGKYILYCLSYLVITGFVMSIAEMSRQFLFLGILTDFLDGFSSISLSVLLPVFFIVTFLIIIYSLVSDMKTWTMQVQGRKFRERKTRRSGW